MSHYSSCSALPAFSKRGRHTRQLADQVGQLLIASRTMHNFDETLVHLDFRIRRTSALIRVERRNLSRSSDIRSPFTKLIIRTQSVTPAVFGAIQEQHFSGPNEDAKFCDSQLGGDHGASLASLRNRHLRRQCPIHTCTGTGRRGAEVFPAASRRGVSRQSLMVCRALR